MKKLGHKEIKSQGIESSRFSPTDLGSCPSLLKQGAYYTRSPNKIICGNEGEKERPHGSEKERPHGSEPA